MLVECVPAAVSELNLSGCSVGKRGMEVLAPWLCDPNCPVTKVDLSGNGIIGGGGQGLIDQVVAAGFNETDGGRAAGLVLSRQ